jgi:hypothetical protein
MINIEQEIAHITNKRDEEIAKLREDSTMKLVTLVNSAFINYQKVGEQIINIKNILPHGDFLPFMADNCLIDVKQIQKLMKIYNSNVQINQKPNGWTKIESEVAPTSIGMSKAMQGSLDDGSFWGA